MRPTADGLTLDRASLLDAALDAIISIDAAGQVLEFNPSAERTFGYTAQEALGRPVEELIIPERSRAAHLAGVMRVVNGGATRIAGRRVPVDARRRDGSEFPAELTITLTSAEPFVATAFIRDLTDRRRLENRLRHLADHDPLTGLRNRRRFEDLLTAALRPARTGACLLVIDLDHFKFVNDSFGHTYGDSLICAVAEVLEHGIGPSDVLARLGGDEFAILLHDASELEATQLARALIEQVEAARPSGVRITASAGVARAADGGASASDLLVAADIALYQAKDAGRANVAVYGGHPGESLAWVERIRHALAADELLLHAQPIVDVRSGDVVREELLVRMRDERGRVLPPGAFMPAAESFGLVCEIDRWVLERGVELAATGRPVHVNVSGPSLSSSELTACLGNLIAESGVNPADLVLEITETTAVANMADARRFVAEVRRFGCGIALDDFGTGFGSLTYLKHLTAHYLKLDMEFVRGIADDPSDRHIVEACVDLARRLNLRTIAEGVEDDRCLATLREIGVDMAQGFHLGIPSRLDA